MIKAPILKYRQDYIDSVLNNESYISSTPEAKQIADFDSGFMLMQALIKIHSESFTGTVSEFVSSFMDTYGTTLEEEQKSISDVPSLH